MAAWMTKGSQPVVSLSVSGSLPSPRTLTTEPESRRNTPACLDSKIHHCNLLNNILAKVKSITLESEEWAIL